MNEYCCGSMISITSSHNLCPVHTFITFHGLVSCTGCINHDLTVDNYIDSLLNLELYISSLRKHIFFDSIMIR